MLQPQARLRASVEIMRVLRSGTKTRLPYCTLYVRPTDAPYSVRIACVVGKKVHKSAVVRHAIQRRVRAACRAITTSIPVSCDVVIVVLDSVVLDVDYQSLIRDIYYGIIEASA